MNVLRAGEFADPVLVSYETRLAELERRLRDMEAERQKVRQVRPRHDRRRFTSFAERYALIGAWLVLIATFGIISPN